MTTMVTLHFPLDYGFHCHDATWTTLPVTVALCALQLLEKVCVEGHSPHQQRRLGIEVSPEKKQTFLACHSFEVLKLGWSACGRCHGILPALLT